MWYRRSLFYVMFAAVLVLPAWVLIARGLFGMGVGWDFLVYLLVCPILALVMEAVTVLIWARKAVREQRAVSVQDAAVLTVAYSAMLAYGLTPSGGVSDFLALAIVVCSFAALWGGVWQWFAETRDRIRGSMNLFESAGQRPPDPRVIRIVPTHERRT